MSIKHILGILTLALAVPSYGVMTLQSSFGRLRTEGDTNVLDNTLWVLLADTGGTNDSFLGTSLDATLNASNANAFLNIGDAINLGSVIGGDTVFAMGGLNAAAGSGSAYDFSTINLDFADIDVSSAGVLAGQEYAIMWFPGVLFSGGATHIVLNSGTAPIADHNIATQVGLINRTNGEPGSGHTGGMVLVDGAISAGAVSEAGLGGGYFTTVGQLDAVILIPEPSSALLALLGSLVLLRRRRQA